MTALPGAAVGPAARAAAARPAASLPELRWGGARLVLLPQRAAWLPELSALLVADVHIGKAASFRRLGAPVPEATTAGTLARLSAALDMTRARRLLVLGDLMHSAAAREAAPATAFAAWRAVHRDLELTLVQGNHDARAGAAPADWHVQAVDEPYELSPGLALTHHPQQLPGRHTLAGHVHPAAVLSGRGPGALRLPCFHFGAMCGLLPAFGEFTGAKVLRAQAGERQFVVADGEVREVPVAPSAAGASA